MASDRQLRLWVRRSVAVGLWMGLLTFSCVTEGWAQVGSARYSSIIVEARSGTVISSVNADELRRPASLTKMMTLYMLFEALRDRRVSLGELVPVSSHAASMQPTKLGLVPGARITVEEAVLGLVTKSANDAAAALAELMGGSEERFAQMMTLRARALGMNRTVFGNASGLPDSDQWSTARDMAILARRLVYDFPGYYGYFSTPSFTFRRRVMYNHDRMLKTYAGADGLKTGYTNESGYNLVTSAVRGGVRLVGVVMGAKSGGERDIHMASLLDNGFEQMDEPSTRHERVARPLPSVFSVAKAAVPTGAFAPRPARTAAAPASGRFSVQVGSFSSKQAAHKAANNARRLIKDGDVHVEPVPGGRGKTLWRAQLSGLSASEAPSACGTLAKRKMACIVIRPETSQVATR